MAVELSVLPGSSSWALWVGSASAASPPGWKLVPMVLVNGLVEKGKVPWQGINSPVHIPALLQQMQSARDEAPPASYLHPAPPALHPGLRGTWIYLCPHCAQWRPLGQVGESAILPLWLCQWICAKGEILPICAEGKILPISHCLLSLCPGIQLSPPRRVFSESKDFLQSFSSSWVWYST